MVKSCEIVTELSGGGEIHSVSQATQAARIPMETTAFSGKKLAVFFVSLAEARDEIRGPGAKFLLCLCHRKADPMAASPGF